MTIDEFITKWKVAQGREDSNSKPFLNDLCHALDLPTPGPWTGDILTSGYIFEAPINVLNTDESQSTKKSTSINATVLFLKPNRPPTKRMRPPSNSSLHPPLQIKKLPKLKRKTPAESFAGVPLGVNIWTMPKNRPKPMLAFSPLPKPCRPLSSSPTSAINLNSITIFATRPALMSRSQSGTDPIPCDLKILPTLPSRISSIKSGTVPARLTPTPDKRLSLATLPKNLANSPQTSIKIDGLILTKLTLRIPSPISLSDAYSPCMRKMSGCSLRNHSPACSWKSRRIRNRFPIA